MSFHPHRFDPFDPFFTFPPAPSCPVASSSLYYHRESALVSPPPFPFHHLPSSHAFDHFSSDLDLFAPPPVSACPYFNSSSLDLFDLDDRFSSLELGARSHCPALKDRFSSLELGARGHCPALKDRFSSLELAERHCPAFKRDVKHTWTTEIKGDRKYKWVAETKNGERQYEYEAEVERPSENGFDRKLKWKAESDGKVKWSKEIKGKGCHEQWAHKYTCEDSLYGDWWKKCHKKECLEPWAHKYICEDSLHGDWLKKCHKKEKCKEGKKEEKKKEKKEKKENHSVKVVEIEDSTEACDAIRKAFHSCCHKGKRKELSPQDAAMMIQMSYRAHLARRSQVLRCLRKMAVAKARLKEIRDLFYSFAYRRRVACDAAEQQTFTQKIKVLLLTVQELEGPDYMVRVAKKSMIEELEAMLEVVDPQPQGSHSSLSKRCRFDLPEGPISEELHCGVSEAVRIIEKED